MKEVENLARTVAPFDISVLILGPNGAGTVSYTHLDVYKRQAQIERTQGRGPKPHRAADCHGHTAGT